MLTYEQVTARYAVHRETIRRWVKDGAFPAPTVRQGHTILWAETDLEKFDAGEGPEGMRCDEQEMTELQQEKDGGWTADAAAALAGDEGRVSPEGVARQMRVSLGLSADASDLQVLGAILDLMNKYHGLKQSIVHLTKSFT